MNELWFLPMALLALPAVNALAAGRAFSGTGGGRASTKAVLLVAFGTSIPEAQKAYDAIDVQTRAAFPGADVRWAYTSRTIRAKLARQGKPVDSPETALARLMDEGCKHVAVLSLHVIPGREFHDLQRNATLFGEMAGGFEKVLIARPLLSSHEDLVRVAHAMIGRIPVSAGPRDAVLLMGHGSGKHPSDGLYSAMNLILQDMAANVYVGTVDGYPTVNDIAPKLLDRKPGKVYLMPFMAVAGAHVRNDMAGDGPDSWKSTLERNGLQCEIVLTGIAEYPEVVEVWLDHLREAFSKL